MHPSEEFLCYISRPQSIRELRLFLPEGKTWAGLFDSPAAMSSNARAAQSQHGAEAAYYTLNTVRSGAATELCAKQINKVTSRPWKTTRDANIDRRDLYLIDIDPVRPSGVSATDAEKASALAVADNVAAYLQSLGWPEPIKIDSGNGYHLLYRGDGCGARSAAWVFVLKHLAEMFDSEEAKVDTSVGNASRISRLPGTWNRKGADTPERPHRMAHVLSYPDIYEELIHGSIFRLAAQQGFIPEADRHEQTASRSTTLLIDETGVRKLIAEYPEVLHLGKVTHDGTTTYFALDECPFAGRAHRNQHVGHGKTTIMLTPDRIGFSCFSGDCGEHTFGDLLRLLHDQTGRWSKIKIWAEPEFEDIVARWGGVVVVDPVTDDDLIDTLTRRAEEALKASAEWQHDAETWATIQSEEFRLDAAVADHKVYGVTAREVLACAHDLKREAEVAGDKVRIRGIDAAVAAEDIKRLDVMIGKEGLFVLSRQQPWVSRERPITKERFMEIMGLTCDIYAAA